MARQRPRTDRQAHWRPTSRMPQELVAQGALSWTVAHQKAHPWYWACRAPGVHTITGQSRQLTLAGGTVTCDTLCQRCTDAALRRA